MTEKSNQIRKINPMSLREVSIMSLQIGFTVAISALLFVWGGKFLDTKLGTGHTYTVLGIFGGMLMALVAVWNIVKPLRDNAKQGFKKMGNDHTSSETKK